MKNMNKKMKIYQLFFVVMLLISFLYTALSFAEILPTEYIGNHPKQLYWINLYSIVTGFGGMYIFLRWFKFRGIANQVKQEPEAAGFAAFCRWTKCRLFFLFLVLLSNMVLYHASSYTETPKYCLLVTYISCVFCWPSLSAFEALRSVGGNEEEKKA